MRIGIIGDTHLGRKLYGYDLTGAIRRVMYKFFEFCVNEQVDLAVHLGDMFDTITPTIAHQKLAVQWLNEFERAGIQLRVLTGNHEVSAGSKATTALDCIKAIPYKYVDVVKYPLALSPADSPELLFLPFPAPGSFLPPVRPATG